MDLISDDELISFMRKHFDTVCQGSLEYLRETLLEDLCRDTRYGLGELDAKAAERRGQETLYEHCSERRYGIYDGAGYETCGEREEL